MTAKKQPIVPDFSGLIRAQAGQKMNTATPKPAAKTGPKLEQNQPEWLSDTDTKTPTVEPVEVEVVEGEWEEPEEQTPAKAGEPLTGIDYKRGGPQTSPDIERQLLVLREAITNGKSVPEIVKEHNIPKRTVEMWLAQVKEEREVNSQIVDMMLIEKMEGVAHEIVRGVDKNKIAKAGLKDQAIAFGIFIDKLAQLRGPRSGGNSTTLRVAWRGGEGAIEVKTD